MIKRLPHRTERAYCFVAEKLPGHEFLIRRLITSDTTFRELCEELADAQTTMTRATSSNDEPRADHANEWEEIVERLTSEILIRIASCRDNLSRE
jgi:hypothetical protein